MPWGLVGREQQMRRVAALLDERAGGVVLAGAAGVGKTRLATEVAALAAARGAHVEWVRATGSSAAIPLGAFAGLVPADERSVLGGARAALAARAAGRPLVLCVDDGHLLDEASAALTHQLVVARAAFVVVTVRHGDAVPDALQALWKDELATRLELRALAPGEVERLLTLALGAPVDGPTLRALGALTRGNALFLRELVTLGRETGQLREDGGIWRWHGELRVGLRLVELVGARLATLTGDERAALEVVALGAPLELGLLERVLGDAGALAGLEAHGLVLVRTEGRRRTLDLVHPLHGEAVRAAMPALRRDAVLRTLADALEACGARRGGDLLRVARWRLDGGGAPDPELFVRAARAALAALDPALAEQLARAATQAGGGFGARLTLGRALAASARAEEADAVLGPLAAVAVTDEDRAAVAIATARNRHWALGRGADAEAVLRRAEAALSDSGLRDDVVAARLRCASAAGRSNEVLAEALPLLADAGVREAARAQAAVAAAEALLVQARYDATAELVAQWLPVAERHRTEVPVAAPVLRSIDAFALRFAGHLEEAAASARATYDAALVSGRTQTPAVEAGSLAYVALARGRVTTALRHFREAAAWLRDGDGMTMLPWALAGLAQAAAQAGDAAAARAAVDELATRRLGHQAFAFELPLARAWCAAAEGELSRARAVAAEASALATRERHPALRIRTLHERTRLGDHAAVADELAVLAAGADGPFAGLAAAYARARVDADPDALLAAADGFAGIDAPLDAAEAATAAARAFAAAGRAASARAAAARSAALLKRCEGARPPTLPAGPTAEALTAREREVALLAARGLSSRAIADRLVVSVRTVDNHLARAYRKLGIARREDLAALVE